MHTDISEVVADGGPDNQPDITFFLLKPLQVILDDFGDMVEDVHLPSVAFIGAYITGAKLAHSIQKLFKPNRGKVLCSGEQFIRGFIRVIVI